ncbi:hypothetical protein BCEP27_130111 [Burkholderia cepacia]
MFNWRYLEIFGKLYRRAYRFSERCVIAPAGQGAGVAREATASGLGRGRSVFAFGSVRFNISISVMAAPTGHHRTPAPKPDRNGNGVRQPAKWIDPLTPNANRAPPAPHP